MQSKPEKKFRFSVGLDTELTLILTLVVGLYIGLGLDVGLGLVLELNSNCFTNVIVVT